MNAEQLRFDVEFYQAIHRRLPDDIEIMKCLADAYTRRGMIQEGLALDRELARHEPLDPSVLFNLACSLSLTDDLDAAARVLADAIRCGWSDFAWLQEDPDLKALRRSPLFARIQRLIARASVRNPRPPGDPPPA